MYHFKFSARTVLELGSELISSDIIAFYELIKNGFDAGTENGVEIRFDVVLRRNAFITLAARAADPETNPEELKADALAALMVTAAPESLEKARNLLRAAESLEDLGAVVRAIHAINTITISDTGSGMSASDVLKNFLVIGTPSRKRDVDKAIKDGATKSPFLGEKGLGRLSAMRLGNRLRLETARTGDAKLNVLEIDWAAFDSVDSMVEDIAIPALKLAGKESERWSGTKLIVGDLTEDWTKEKVGQMVRESFSRLTDPFLDQKARPRVVIFWNSERETIPWMDKRLLAAAHASISGRYEFAKDGPQLVCSLHVNDLGFPHPKEKDELIIKLPDLQAAFIGVSGNIHKDTLKSIGPFTFEAHWFNRRRLTALNSIGDLDEVKDLQKRWSGIMLFRDGFKVFPYGDEEDDWLGLDRRALGERGYLLNKTQFIGRVVISRTGNPQLIDQTNREGLRHTPEQELFVSMVQHGVDRLRKFIQEVERQYKAQKIDLAEAKDEISALEKRAKSALKQLRKIAPEEGQEIVEDLQQTVLEFSEFAERARERVSQVEDESMQMIEMAGIGLMVEVVAHELARASEAALENLEALRKREVPDEIKGTLEALRAQMKSLSKRVRILDPLSIAGRQRAETFNLNDLIGEIVEAHAVQFKRHGIQVVVDPSKAPCRIRVVKGMVVQIIENLISNSKYWMQMRKEKEKSYMPQIRISIHPRPPTVTYEDNGIGIAPENKDKIFKPFFSLKEKSKRRGLGLFIARECAAHQKGTLTLDENSSLRSERLHRFILELPANCLVE